jgi:hypothetical protein
MIDRCFNPNCRRQLHYLRDGRVVRVLTGAESSRTTEHFWLCGPCFEEYDFVLHPGGKVSIEARPRPPQSVDYFFADVTLPEMERPPRPAVIDRTRREAA